MILLIILARECRNMLITKARLRQIIKEEQAKRYRRKQRGMIFGISHLLL